MEIRDYDEVLTHIGGWNRYQGTLLFFLFAFCSFSAYVTYGPVLFLYTPDHHCKIPQSFIEFHNRSYEEILNLTIPLDENAKRSQCEMYNISSEGDIDENDIVDCKFGYEYDIADYFTSIVTDLDWVCQDSWKGPFTQSMFSVGGVFGILIFGYAADHYGRFPVVFISNFLIFLFGMATPFCPNFISFVILRFLIGLSFDIHIRSLFLLGMEYVSINKRAMIGTLSSAFGYSFGAAYIVWLLKYLKDWKIWHLILFSQTSVILVTPLFLHESIRWLASQDRVRKCEKILKSIANTNGKVLEKDFFPKFEELVKRDNEVTKKASKLTWMDLFKTPKLRKNSILMIISWMLVLGLYDAHIRNTSNLQLTFYVTYTVGACLEMPACIAMIWSMDNLGRRWSVSGSLFISGICMLASALCQENDTALSVLSIIGRFWAICATAACQQYVFEVFPTPLRAQGNSIATLFTQVTQFISPYVAYSDVISPILPPLILGLVSFIASITSIYLPETAGVDLPQTIEEAETFSNDQNFFYVPILQNKTKERKMELSGKDNVTVQINE